MNHCRLHINRFQNAMIAAMLAMPTIALADAPQAREITPDRVAKADQLRQDLREMITLARDQVFPALVNIKVITVRYWGGKEQKGQSVGSGTIISPEGHILTNYHVVENGAKFKCTLADKQEITAELVGEDPLTDLAVLKLDLSEVKTGTPPLHVARLGDSDQVQIGDTVMAMGSPFALSRSVSLGIVSNTERILTTSEDDPPEMRFNRDQRTGIFNRWIQHDAAINPGNSGGPLVNLAGEVIGVNTRGMSFGGDMGFAIPANVAKSVAERIIEHGEVPRSWYGINLKPIKKTGFEEGVLVNSIVTDAPAANAGIQAGDVIIAVDGDPVTVWFPEEVPPLLKMLADRPAGSKVAFTLKRDGETIETTVTTDKMKKDRGEEAAFRAWGFAGVEITELMARARRLDSTDGVLVQSVRRGGSADQAEPSLSTGDVIRSIDGEAVHTLEDLIAIYERTMDLEKLPEYLLIEFDRAGKNQITLVKPKPEKEEDAPRELPKAWVGIAVQPMLPKLARQIGDEDAVGFRITRVYPKTLAADADLKVGDIILALNGTRLAPRAMQDGGLLHRAVRTLDIDGEATLTVLRGDDKLEVTVPLERTRITPAEARRDVNREFDLTVREVTFFDRDENRWDEDTKGVIVDQVESAGWAQLGGINPGDLIQRIGENDIKGLTSYREAIEAVTKAEPERIVFVVLRGESTRFQFVEPEWSPVAGEGEQDDSE